MNIYSQRREKLLTQMRLIAPNSVAYIANANEVIRSRDSYYPYHYNNYFYYLTGFTEANSSLLLIAGHNSSQDQTILFCQDKNPKQEIWNGCIFGPDYAATKFSLNAAYSINLQDKILPGLLVNRRAIFTSLSSLTCFTPKLNACLENTRKNEKNGTYSPRSLHDLDPLLDELRLLKDETEIATMRRAAQISAAAHCKAMQICKHGLHEFELEAELLHTFRKSGAQHVAYNSIVAAGKNACVLHHQAGNDILNSGDLCLIDAACELDGYAADITRTFPVNGKFTAPQRELYQLVLDAQKAAIAVLKPGACFSLSHEAAVSVLTKGMLDLKLLDANLVGTLEDALAQKAYTKFYMHRTNHWLGMDVHDCGSYRDFSKNNAVNDEKNMVAPWRKLQIGMVLTVEPGIYVHASPDIPECYWNLGIRIEDDAVINANGCELLSRDVPVDIKDIEALML